MSRELNAWLLDRVGVQLSDARNSKRQYAADSAHAQARAYAEVLAYLSPGTNYQDWWTIADRVQQDQIDADNERTEVSG